MAAKKYLSLIIAVLCATILHASNEKYDTAGILPIVKVKSTLYAALEKIPVIKQLELHGEFAGIPQRQDLNQAQLTAARAFASRADIRYQQIFKLLKEQCAQKSCIIKSTDARSVIFPLLVPIDVLDDLKVPYALINLNNLEEIANYALRENKTRENKSRNFFGVAQGGTIIQIRRELVEALAAGLKSRENIFTKLKKTQ
jgi:hypothetical protein